MLRVQDDLNTAHKHLRLALSDENECSLSKAEIRFIIAHVYEQQNKVKTAKEAYEQLLEVPDLPPLVKANTLRQLGWMYHTVPTLGDQQTREAYAIQCLQKSIDSDPTSGQSWYFLGRCFSSIGKVHDAFVSYRHSIDKSEASADTWCSIGVLYQQQSQPMDALQAYICAVQLDKTHSAAWIDLAILYESCNQPKDALACYINAAKNNTKESVSADLTSRIKILQQQLNAIPAQYFRHKTKTLPSIEEAWSLPIPAELTSRQGATNQQVRAGGMGVQPPQALGSYPPTSTADQPPLSPPSQPHYTPGMASDQPPPSKRRKASSTKTKGEDLQPACFLSPQQINMLNYLQQNQGSLNTQQQQLMQQLQQQYLLQLHTAQQQQQQQQQQQKSDHFAPHPQHIPPSTVATTTSTPSTSSASELMDSMLVSKDIQQTVSDQDIGALLSRHDIALAEDLLAQIAQNHPENKDLPSDSRPSGSGVGKASGASRDARLSESVANSEEKQWCTEIEKGAKRTPRAELTINMTSEQVIKAAEGYGEDGVWNTSILGPDCPPPAPPATPQPPLPRDKLNPPTPSVYLESKKDACSIELAQYCLSQPVCVIRGLAGALKLDLGLFSTKSLVEANADHMVEIRTQRQQAPDENTDQYGNNVWRCESSRSHTSIAKYAQYQAASFQESLKEEQDKAKGVYRESDSDSNSSTTAKGPKKKKYKMIKFGTNVDLSDERKWKPQLQELTKLPPFTRLVSASNMLSHIGHTILGMNSVQLYMKVPGSRTPGHQENNDFCSVNINIGPGDVEWFTTPEPYWGAIHRLCEKSNINYLKGSWWPNLDDLFEANIPVYRFIQKPGDLVWVGPGAVHWVQAIGWCNNIAWNVGPLTWRMYQLAINRYEFNKLQGYKSIVPCKHMSWNLARNIKVTDPKLFEQIKMSLMLTLHQCQLEKTFVEKLGKEVRWHGRSDNEVAHYCNDCDVEVFNILYVRSMEQDKKHVVHCMECARRLSSALHGFAVLMQYKFSQLKQLYDNFQLGTSEDWI